MKLSEKILTIAIIAGCSVGAVALIYQYSAAQETRNAVATKEKREPGIVRFPEGAPQLSSLRAQPVEQVPIPVADPVNGRIAYDESVTARVSSPIAGRIVALHAEIGDTVRRDASLAEIDAPDLAAAEADWRKGAADEMRKKLAFDRARNLYEHEVIARKDLESAEADYQQAVAETKRAGLRMKNLNAAGNENGAFRLRSPIAGVVADRQVNPGLEVRPDLPNPLFVVTDITRLWVLADVPERSVANIRPGQQVGIETDAYPNERFPATVDRVGLALDPVTRRVQVRCTVRNLERKLKPEMFARVSFLADGGRKGVQVPNTGLIADGIYSYVFVERQPGTYEKRRVRLALKGHDASFVESGLTPGERVVTEGALLLNSEAAPDAE